MDYRLISLDLDGTLLNNAHEISKTTLDIIRTLKNMGVIIVINTGRSFNACIYYAKLIEADYIVGCNGAFVYDCHKKTIQNPYPMDKDDAYSIIEMLYRYKEKIKIQWDSFETYYSNNITPFEDNYIKNYLRDFPKEIFNYKIISEVEDIKLIKNEEIYQVFFHPMTKDVDAYFTIVENLKTIKGINMVDFSKEYTDINHQSATKGRALKDLAEVLGIDSKDILVFGDGDNDISMFKYAGHAIAMENACDNLKKLAHEFTLHHNEDGVAHALSGIYKLQLISE